MKNKLIYRLLTLPAVVFLFAAGAQAQTSEDKKMPLTEGGRYFVTDTVKIKKAFEKLDGRIEILRDARIDADVYFMQSNGFEPDLDTDDAKIKEMFAKEPFRPGVLRLTDASGKVLDSVKLECVSAGVKRVYLYSASRPSYEVTCFYTNVAPYGGSETIFFDLRDSRLRRIEAVDRKTGQIVPMSFVWSHRCGWDYTLAGAGKDILNVFTGWDDRLPGGGGFNLLYERFHFNGKNWIRYQRLVPEDYWEDEFEFPKLSQFPKAR